MLRKNTLKWQAEIMDAAFISHFTQDYELSAIQRDTAMITLSANDSVNKVLRIEESKNFFAILWISSMVWCSIFAILNLFSNYSSCNPGEFFNTCESYKWLIPLLFYISSTLWIIWALWFLNNFFKYKYLVSANEDRFFQATSKLIKVKSSSGTLSSFLKYPTLGCAVSDIRNSQWFKEEDLVTIRESLLRERATIWESIDHLVKQLESGEYDEQKITLAKR